MCIEIVDIFAEEKIETKEDRKKRLKKEYDKKNYEKRKEYFKNHHKKWYKRNKEKALKDGKKWRDNNKEKYNEYYKKKYREDPLFRLRKSYSSLFSNFFKEQGNSKQGRSCMSFVSYTIKELKVHLESLWTEDMNWDNHNTEGWVIDHIIPKSFFNALNPVEIRMCWRLDNLQPLWAEENLSKGDKMILWGEEIRAKDYNNLIKEKNNV